MNTLMQRMREELVRRNYAATTIHSYTKAVEHFQRHINKPLDQLGPDDLRSYHAHLLGDRKLAVNTVVLNICALRFLYIKVLKRRDMKEDLPYPKQRQRLPVNDYIGTSIEMKPAPAVTASGSPWTAWLLLVEAIPAGTQGTPVARNVVRNSLQSIWGGDKQLSQSEQARFFEFRPMRIPPGSDVGRLRVVGWVQDAQGHVLTAAQSRCKPAG